MDVAHALAAWAKFPIHAGTSPMIITGPPLQDPGLVSDEAKVAFLQHRLEMADGVPDCCHLVAAEIGPLISGPDHVLAC